MTGETDLNAICELLTARYGDEGAKAAQHLHRWMSGRVPGAHPDMIAGHLKAEHLELLFDAFRDELAFGTAGARGPVGYGPNRFNMATVLKTIQGHCDYLRELSPDRDQLQLVVANDVRVFWDVAGIYHFLGDGHPLLGVTSRTFAKRACEVYAANGVTVYLADPADDDALMSTPMLSFLIAQLGAAGGVNLSASHNPPDDNGIKLYDQFGGQLVPPDDQALSEMMDRVEHVRAMPFEEALDAGRIRAVPDELLRTYVETYVCEFGPARQQLPDDATVVYTPLCGCGLATAAEVLKALGIRCLVPDGQGPDGTFSAIPLRIPNPEVAVSATPAKDFADEQDIGVVLSSDPDADRVGVDVKLADGSWYHFDGNQIAATICYFLMLDPQGPQKRGLVIETLVTTRLLGEIVKEAAKSGECWIVDDLLVGFKYIADVLLSLDENGRFGDIRCRPDQLVLAAEESHGIGTLPCVRDKDSAPACMYMAALHQRVRRENRTLADYYADVLGQLGHYDSTARSIMMRGAEGDAKKLRLMASLRQSPPTTLAGRRVVRVEDHWDEVMYGEFLSETDKNSRDVIQYFVPGRIITVRPSGTEPKLKVYCQLLPEGDDPGLGGAELLRELRVRTDGCAMQVCEELLDRVGVSLGEAGMRIIDVVDIDQKADFDSRIVPLLRGHLEDDTFGDLQALHAWLGQETARMTPGADPLVAIKPALAYLSEQWAEGLAGNHVFERLRDWTVA